MRELNKIMWQVTHPYLVKSIFDIYRLNDPFENRVQPFPQYIVVTVRWSYAKCVKLFMNL